MQTQLLAGSVNADFGSSPGVPRKREVLNKQILNYVVCIGFVPEEQTREIINNIACNAKQNIYYSSQNISFVDRKLICKLNIK